MSTRTDLWPSSFVRKIFFTFVGRTVLRDVGSVNTASDIASRAVAKNRERIIASCEKVYTDYREAIYANSVGALDLSGKHLHHLDVGILFMRELRVLIMQNNFIEELPNSVHNLTQLELLDLSNNKLRTITDEIGKISQLKILDLRGNPLLIEEIEKVRRLLPTTQVLFEDQVVEVQASTDDQTTAELEKYEQSP